MRVTVKGKSNKDAKKELSEAVKFFGKSILTPRLFANCYIEIRIKKMLDVSGYCEIIEEGKRNPTSFILQLKTAEKLEMLSTLAHEMVHVKQYRKGILRHTRNDNFMRWGKEVIDLREVDYFELPWEKEAYAGEEELIEEYKNFLKST
jgi:hypothetical protein